MADTSIIVAGITALPLLITSLAQWRDMRKRTNGTGPLAAKLDEQNERLTRIEDRVARTEERTGRMERFMASEARAKRQLQ